MLLSKKLANDDVSFEPEIIEGRAERSFTEIQFENQGFEMLFKEHFVPLCIYCENKYAIDSNTAKEAVHSAFVKLWECREGLIPGMSVKAYMYKIVNNVILDNLRHQKVIQKHESHFARGATITSIIQDYDSVDFKELKNDVEKAIKNLPVQTRIIFELSRFSGLKYQEIAQHLGISVKTVETQMCRALSKLRRKLAHRLILCFALLLGNF